MRPTTKEGKALLDRLVKDSVHFNDPDLARIIAAIEAEASQQERERIRREVHEYMEHANMVTGYLRIDRDDFDTICDGDDA